MSLLLQALQRAAKSREVTGQEPETGSPRLELEPHVPARTEPGAATATALNLDEIDPSPPMRRTAPAPSSLPSAADYGGPTLLDYIRERPVVAFGALAVLFAVCYGVYLYMQIFHPQWARGDFGGTPNLTVGTPPPVAARPPAPAAGSDVYSGPATTYPPVGTPTATAPNGATAPIPLPGMPPQMANPSPPPSPTSVNENRQNAELANLMNLPARPAGPAAREQSRLSSLGNALSDTPAAATLPPKIAPPVAARPKEPPLPAAAVPASPRSNAPAPVTAPRQSTSGKTNLTGPKPLSAAQAQSGANVIELKDQVVVNAAPTQQIEAATVADAYRAWRGGKLEQAREIYRDVLANDPRNVDALLGLGGIAQQQGNSQEALSFFGRALELEPRNSSAQAGIIAMTGQSDPAASESRLKQLIARDPSAFLHFTLGNLYARQSQWAQAQQSYFQAYSMNADNSDYAYNLAVSLEHIGQDKLAVNYYRKAVDLSLKQGGRASFNQEQVIERIAKLSLRTR